MTRKVPRMQVLADSMLNPPNKIATIATNHCPSLFDMTLASMAVSPSVSPSSAMAN
jgi:hypothetical protein